MTQDLREPDLEGRVIVITGANSGLGLATARNLAGRGAHVVMACRDPRRADAAVTQVRDEFPSATLSAMQLDLASLASISRFVKELRDAHAQVDVLINNAGVMGGPRRETADGFELQLGTNFLGHFALTAGLMGALERADRARVVTLGSLSHQVARLDFDDLMAQRRYSSWLTYARSKVATLLFSFELERRLRASGRRTISVAAHPGYAATEILRAGTKSSVLGALVLGSGNSMLAQSAEQGALPTLYAATAFDVKGGEYFGPDGWFELRGRPRRVTAAAHARNESDAKRLWDAALMMTGARWFE